MQIQSTPHFNYCNHVKSRNTLQFKGALGDKVLESIDRLEIKDEKAVSKILKENKIGILGIAPLSKIKDIIASVITRTKAINNVQYLLKQAEVDNILSSARVLYDVKNPDENNYSSIGEQLIVLTPILNKNRNKIRNTNSTTPTDIAKALQNKDGVINSNMIQFLSRILDMNRTLTQEDLLEAINLVKDEGGNLDINKSAQMIALNGYGDNGITVVLENMSPTAQKRIQRQRRREAVRNFIQNYRAITIAAAAILPATGAYFARPLIVAAENEKIVTLNESIKEKQTQLDEVTAQFNDKQTQLDEATAQFNDKQTQLAEVTAQFNDKQTQLKTEEQSNNETNLTVSQNNSVANSQQSNEAVSQNNSVANSQQSNKAVSSKATSQISLSTISQQQKDRILSNLSEFGIKYEINNNNLLVLNKYKRTKKMAEANFNEDELFKLVEEIKGDADFRGSLVTNLGNLKKIGGDADFRGSLVTNLGNLEEIGDDADFRDSQIRNLGNLKKIGDDADFWGSQVTNLGNLEEIGGYADFSCSQIRDLGNLKKIGGNLTWRSIRHGINPPKNLNLIGGYILCDKQQKNAIPQRLKNCAQLGIFNAFNAEYTKFAFPMFLLVSALILFIVGLWRQSREFN